MTLAHAPRASTSAQRFKTGTRTFMCLFLDILSTGGAGFADCASLAAASAAAARFCAGVFRFFRFFFADSLSAPPMSSPGCFEPTAGGRMSDWVGDVPRELDAVAEPCPSGSTVDVMSCRQNNNSRSQER